MAEGGGSINHGSDADFEYTCSPCTEDDIRVEAVKYCPVCEEYLCTTCTRHHGRQKLLRSHSLLDCDATLKAPAVTMVTKCRYHPDRDIEMYCGEHDMVYCLKCIATEHRSCKDVLGLENVKISSNQHKEIERLQTDTSDIQTRLEETERKTQANIDNVEKQKGEVISQIEETERELIDHIRKLKQEAMETLETEYITVKENMETNISQIRCVKIEIERYCHQLQAVDNLDKRQQFVQTKCIQHTVNNARKIIGESEAKGCHDLSFTENKELKFSIVTSTSLGSIQNVIGICNQLSSKVYKVSSMNEISVKMTTDKKVCYIVDICQLPDGTIILADNSNSRIKRLDVNYNIKDYCDVGYSPTGICCTGNTEVAVKLSNNKVQFISVGSSLSKLRDISVTGGDYEGIAYCDGELWLSTGSGVNVYSMSGTLLKTISKDVNGQNIFKYTTKHMAVSGDTVIVTDYSDGAVCLRRDGSVIRELRDGRLTDTFTVCVDNDGTVFIAGYSSNNIVMFDRDGTCLGEFLYKEGGLNYPISMCYDKKKKCLLVFNDSSNTMVVLNMSN